MCLCFSPTKNARQLRNEPDNNDLESLVATDVLIQRADCTIFEIIKYPICRDNNFEHIACSYLHVYCII